MSSGTASSGEREEDEEIQTGGELLSGTASFPSASVTTINGSAEFMCDASKHSSFLLIPSCCLVGRLALPYFVRFSGYLLAAVFNLFSLCLCDINLLRSSSIFDENDSRDIHRQL
jgi:hypothetical protein